jgi:hypothetical protein
MSNKRNPAAEARGARKSDRSGGLITSKNTQACEQFQRLDRLTATISRRLALPQLVVREHCRAAGLGGARMRECASSMFEFVKRGEKVLPPTAKHREAVSQAQRLAEAYRDQAVDGPPTSTSGFRNDTAPEPFEEPFQ